MSLLHHSFHLSLSVLLSSPSHPSLANIFLSSRLNQNARLYPLVFDLHRLSNHITFDILILS